MVVRVACGQRTGARFCARCRESDSGLAENPLGAAAAGGYRAGRTARRSGARGIAIPYRLEGAWYGCCGGVSHARGRWAGTRVGRPRRRPRPAAPARVVRADGAAASCWPRRRARSAPPGPALVTGDWAQYRPAADPADTGTAVRLPRRTELVRGAGGRAAARQVLAANVDLVFVLVSLAAPPSAGRLDRLLAVAWDSGARPVVVLTKADLAEGTAAAERDEVAETAVGRAGAADQHGRRPRAGRAAGDAAAGPTAALLGVSGAGKSSLRNALGAGARGPVAPVGRTGKGRHTTTARELVLLPGGGLLLDTPGLRGVQLWAADGALTSPSPTSSSWPGGAASGTAGTPASRAARSRPRSPTARSRPAGWPRTRRCGPRSAGCGTGTTRASGPSSAGSGSGCRRRSGPAGRRAPGTADRTQR